MKEIDLNFILRVLRVMSDVDCCDDLWWNMNDECATISFFINCSDVFWWATSDYEEITPHNIDELEKVVTDIQELADDNYHTKMSILRCAPLLFISRVRKMRPQGAYYKFFDRKLWALFDACGPEREINLVNPVKPTMTMTEPLNQVQEKKKINILTRVGEWFSNKFNCTNVKD